MDRILEGYLEDYVINNGLEHLKNDEAYEIFVNYAILSRIISEPVSIDNISIGGGGDIGIDGLAIIVNDHIVSSKEDIDYFKKTLRRLEARFIFIQSKNSDKFDMGALGNFLFGIRTFFDKKISLIANPEIQNAHDLKEHIYKSSIDMEKSPTCEMFYVTTGKWVDDTNLVARIKAEIDALKLNNLFSEVNFYPIDGENIKRIYRELNNRIVKQIRIDRYINLPSINEVKQALLGVIPAKEYLKLITDVDDNLQRNLFYDNVRDYQGNNPVNVEIAETIRNSSYNDRFALLNNGVTIVAKSITQVGNDFTIREFQIVNGCQTSHEIYLNRKQVTDQIYLPIKLIWSDNQDIMNMVIKATNRQTEVKIEAFESLQPFHKQLEEFYNTFKNDEHLYYERRSKQYDYMPVQAGQIITIATQAKCFLGMFLNEPHSTHRYYGELLKSYEDKLFQESHSLYPYYISGYAYHLLEHLFFTKQIPNEYKIFRFHLLMMFRLIAENSDLPYLNSRKIEKYCLDLRDILWDTQKALQIFKNATELIEKNLSLSTYSAYESSRRKAFTQELIACTSKSYDPRRTPLVATVQREHGVVIWYSEVKGYGFIKGQYKDNIFFHHTEIKPDEFGNCFICPNDNVEFALGKNEKGLLAKNIEIVN